MVNETLSGNFKSYLAEGMGRPHPAALCRMECRVIALGKGDEGRVDLDVFEGGAVVVFFQPLFYGPPAVVSQLAQREWGSGRAGLWSP